MRGIIIILSVMCMYSKCFGNRNKFVKYESEIANYDKQEDINFSDDSPLKEFLERYGNINNNNRGISRDPYIGKQDKPTSWDSPHASSHNYNSNKEKNEWVTLDVIPWSVSKVSKWKSNHKSNNNNNWDQISAENDEDRHWLNKQSYEYIYHKPSRPDAKPITVNPLTCDQTDVRGNSQWNKPLQNTEYEDERDVITDGLPSNFPIFEKLTQRHSSSTSSKPPPVTNGDGEWILLSTTKGYKYSKPKRRSLQI